MVNLVKVSLYILLYFPLLAFSKPSINVLLKDSSVEYGRPVYLTIVTVDMKEDLSLLRLDELSSSFSIESIDLESEKLVNKKNKTQSVISQQTLSIKMFPRLTGKLFIPVFNQDNISSEIIEVTILEANNNGQPIQLNSSSSSLEVWQREKILISLTLVTVDEFATIKLRKQDVGGIEITPLPVNRVWNGDINNGHSIIRTGWSILPLRPGATEIELPAIEYYLNGVVRRVFYLPKLKLNIRPLPSYLPPTIPVGKISVKTSISVKDSEHNGLLYTDDLAYWNISIESKSLTPYWLPPILRQIKSSEEVTFFPANSTRGIKPDESGVNGSVVHSIPFKPLANGAVSIPDLNIQYFDPETGLLETLVHKTTKHYSFGIISRSLALILVGLLLLFLGASLFHTISEKIRDKKRRQQAEIQIRQAASAEELIIGVRMVSTAEGWPSNISLTDWLERWKKKGRTTVDIDELIQSLSLLRYAGNHQIISAKKMGNITTELANIVSAKF